MIYLKKFVLLDEFQEFNIIASMRRVNNSTYPFHIFTTKQLQNIDFQDITCFYGGNGSGKTTLLNIIAQKINATYQEYTHKSDYFDAYVNDCAYKVTTNIAEEAKIISSDDVFNNLLDIRAINSHVNRRKDEIGRDYLNYKYAEDSYAINDYKNIKNSYEAKNKSMSRYIRERLNNNNLVEQSNGEAALMFWEKEIKENAIYILDEPENSLSAENQIKLKKFIEESVRFYNCQFIISTHSPFFLSLDNALIYDLDSIPVVTKNWVDLPNVRTYYEFFKEKKDQFEK